MTDIMDALPPFKLVGGALCLDFVNTVGNWHDPGGRREYLTSYGALVAWALRADIVDEEDAAALRNAAARDPNTATRVLDEARTLRGALHAVLLAAGHGGHADTADLATVNDAMSRYLAESRLVPDAGRYRVAWGGHPAALHRVLWPVVRSAVEVLTEADPARLRECEGESCGWLFLDTSRAGRRRWCDMADCGNVAKVRRYRKRHPSADGPQVSAGDT